MPEPAAERVVPVPCAPKTYPCPDCGRRGGTLGLDELHLGEFTLLLATDPIADCAVGFSLVRINDQAHMRWFLRTLQYRGFEPKGVVTDGSNLYPAVLAEHWPEAR